MEKGNVADLSELFATALKEKVLTPGELIDLAEEHRVPLSTLVVAQAMAQEGKTYEEMLQAAFEPLRGQVGSVSARDTDEFWSEVQSKGGWWSAEVKNPPAARGAKLSSGRAKVAAPQFDGSAEEYPFNLLP